MRGLDAHSCALLGNEVYPCQRVIVYRVLEVAALVVVISEPFVGIHVIASRISVAEDFDVLPVVTIAIAVGIRHYAHISWLSRRSRNPSLMGLVDG